MPEDLEQFPDWCMKLSANRNHAVTQMPEFTRIEAINHGDFGYEVSVLERRHGLQEFEFAQGGICARICPP
jgi:hypothetical protein